MMITAEQSFSIAMMAQNGARTGLMCPFCHGGSGHEKSFAVDTRIGVIFYRCWRASCGAYGRLSEQSREWIDKVRDRAPDTSYRGHRKPLLKDDVVYFRQRFELHENHLAGIFVTEKDEYLLPIKGPTGLHRGDVVRQPLWSGQPLPPRCGRADAPKTHTYLEPGEFGMAWYKPQFHAHTIVLVEDQISAMKVAAYADCKAAALLGCGLNDRQVREVQLQHPSTVILALDKDATGQALAHARKYGPALPGMRVALLEQDLKDTPKGELCDVLGIIR